MFSSSFIILLIYISAHLGVHVTDTTLVDSPEVQQVTVPVDFSIEQTPENLFLLANKQYPLGGNFKPKEIILATVRQKYGNTLLPATTNQAAMTLFNAAKNEGIHLVLSSGYRDYGFQKALYDQQVKKVGSLEANRWVAKPGESEHQTGLAIDITCDAVGLRLTEAFEDTAEFEWLRSNAADYGFILRYPKGKESETGYGYEPWHFRYIGDSEIANYIWLKDLSYEAYLSDVVGIDIIKNND